MMKYIMNKLKSISIKVPKIFFVILYDILNCINTCIHYVLCIIFKLKKKK